MEEELTLEDVENAMKIIKEDNTCPKCNTERTKMVLGIYSDNHLPLFCKCETDRLCKTPYVKGLADDLKNFLRLS